MWRRQRPVGLKASDSMDTLKHHAFQACLLAAALEERFNAHGFSASLTLRKLACSPQASSPRAAARVLKAVIRTWRRQISSQSEGHPVHAIVLELRAVHRTLQGMVELEIEVAHAEGIEVVQRASAERLSPSIPEPRSVTDLPEPHTPSPRARVRDGASCQQLQRSRERQHGARPGTTQASQRGTRLLQELRKTISLADELLLSPGTPVKPGRAASPSTSPEAAGTTGYTSVEQSRLEAQEMMNLATRLNDIVKRHVERESPPKSSHFGGLRRIGAGESAASQRPSKQHEARLSATQHRLHSASQRVASPAGARVLARPVAARPESPVAYRLELPSRTSPEHAVQRMRDTYTGSYQGEKERLARSGETQSARLGRRPPARAGHSVSPPTRVAQKCQRQIVSNVMRHVDRRSPAIAARRPVAGWLNVSQPW